MVKEDKLRMRNLKKWANYLKIHRNVMKPPFIKLLTSRTLAHLHNFWTFIFIVTLSHSTKPMKTEAFCLARNVF